MRKKSAKQPASSKREVRTALAREYHATFGHPWDETPWGCDRWGDVLKRGLSVDRRYKEADGHLAEVVGAFRSAVAFLRARQLDPFGSTEPWDLGEFAGKTLPEAQLALEMTDPGGAFSRAFTLVEHFADEQVRNLWHAAPDDSVPRLVLPHGEPDTIGFDRRLHLVRVNDGDRAARDATLLAGLRSPPPRSLTSPKEWRRRYLVDVLGDLKRAHQSSSGEWFWDAPRYSDRDIAVVSLLCGGLDELTPRRCASPQSTVNAERKAIGLVRRRWSPQAHLRPSARREVDGANDAANGAETTGGVNSEQPVPTRLKSSATYRVARAFFETEYTRRFGKIWDTPPWDRRGWDETLRAALELDRTYLACMDVLRRLIVALERARNFFDASGWAEATAASVLDRSIGIGKTWPEFYLFRMLWDENQVVVRAHERLRALESRLRSRWNIGLGDTPHRPPPPARPGETAIANTVVPLRGLVHLTTSDKRTGEVIFSGWAPGIVPPPPDSLRTDTHEWRRWYISTVLEAYDRTLLAREGGFEGILETDLARRTVVSDSDVAVVSLLAGGLEFYSAAQLARPSDVLNAERKAVGLARKRTRAALAAHWVEGAFDEGGIDGAG